jgi:acetyl-CoA synthetase
VTGHTYIVYGPLANGATTLMFEGVPAWPDNGRFWQVVDKHQVNIFYTAPTAIRALMRDGEAPVTARAASRCASSAASASRSIRKPGSGTTAWWARSAARSWDTWWQTETGGILISRCPARGAEARLGHAAAARRVPGTGGRRGPRLEGATEGNLVHPRQLARPDALDLWRPCALRPDLLLHLPASTSPATAPAASPTAIGGSTGRVDDVINVSGHRMGTAEVESALVAHPKVAGGRGGRHAARHQGPGHLRLRDADGRRGAFGRAAQGAGRLGAEGDRPIASPDAIQWAPGLPKTRSGKIMRRILRKIAANETDSLGDTSTLADPTVVQDLVENRVG